MSQPIELVRPHSAPNPIGPYAPFVRCGDWVFASALGAIDAKTGTVVSRSVVEQTTYVLETFRAMLQEVGGNLDRIVNVVVYLKDMNDFAEMNAAYAACFGSHRPARSVVSVIDLPKPGVHLTISFTAILE